ncbi:hypothetical protein BG000_009687 [Podila horticola]|nr:hypothetical protein BG000_009687 [Podila horticola]
MTNRVTVAKLLMIVNDRINRSRIQNSSLAKVILDISEPVCDPATAEDPALLHCEEMRRRHLEDSIQLLDHGERALRKDEDRCRVLEAQLAKPCKV